MFIKGWFYHGVKVSKWENENNGRKNVSFSIEKSYKEKESGEYKTSSTFFSDDLDALIQCLIAAKQESVKVILPKSDKIYPATTDDVLREFKKQEDDLDVPF